MHQSLENLYNFNNTLELFEENLIKNVNMFSEANYICFNNKYYK